MSYLVLARKYRPTTFDEVVGQETAATTLKNAINSGHVAHAYLFSGPRGVGKTSMARIMAKALNCEKGPTPEPCNKCSICKSIDTGDDVDVIEIDGASNRGIDEIRSLRNNARYAPARSRNKIYIIDEVHMLTKDAFNALLKTLEEPPDRVKFIFATTEPHKLLDTIKSRCQRFDFRRIPSPRIAEHLARICKKEKIKVGDGVLDAVARAAHGGMRDAQSLLDQLASSTTETVSVEDFERLVGGVSRQTVVELLGAVAAHDAKKAVELVSDAFSKGVANDELVEQLIEGFRELLLARVAGADSPLIDRGEADRAAIGELAQKFTTDSLMYLVQMFAEAKRKARESSQSRVVLELAVVKAADAHQLRPLDEILSRLRLLQLGSVAGRSPVRTQGPSAEPAPSPASSPKRTGDLWTDAVAVIEQQNPGLAAFVSSGTCQPGPEDGTHVVELGPVPLEHAERNKGLIEHAVSQVVGTPCSVQLRSITVDPQPAAKARRTRRAQPKGEHVKKLIDVFDARVVASSDGSPNAEK